MTHIQITPNAPDFRAWLLILIMALFMILCLSSCKESYYVNDSVNRNEGTYIVITSFDHDSLLKSGFVKSKKKIR